MFEGITSYERLISVGILGNYFENHVFSSLALLGASFVGAFVLCCAVAYLIGSVNFGVLLSKKMYGADVRTQGSGNAGATNMLRSFGAKAGVLTLLGDAAKGYIAVMLARCLLGSACGYVAALFAILGHAFPIYFHFKGGKGVAVSLGSVLALNWVTAIMLVIIFVLVAATTKYVSLGSMTAAAFFPIITDRIKGFVIRGAGQMPMIAPFIAFLIGALIVWLHRSNLKRLFNKTEPKIELHKKHGKTDGGQSEGEGE